MRISDWSSDVCSSDLPQLRRRHLDQRESHLPLLREAAGLRCSACPGRGLRGQGVRAVLADRGRALLVMRSVRMRGTVLLAGLLLALPLSAAAAPAPTAVAVFYVEPYDTSLEGELRGRDPADRARLGQTTHRPLGSAPGRERVWTTL